MSAATTNLKVLAAASRLWNAAIRRDPGQYVYAIQAGENGPIKIGITTWPADRILTLQQGNAEELRGIAAWPSLPVEEKDIHREFAYARIRGEWFHPVPDLVEMVLAMGGLFCDWEKGDPCD